MITFLKKLFPFLFLMRETESEGEGERGIKRGREGRREKTERERREKWPPADSLSKCLQ